MLALELLLACLKLELTGRRDNIEIIQVLDESNAIRSG
jgi:hypothetical protein